MVGIVRRWIFRHPGLTGLLRFRMHALTDGSVDGCDCRTVFGNGSGMSGAA